MAIPLNKLHLTKDSVTSEKDGFTCIDTSFRKDPNTGEVSASVEIATLGRSTIRVKFPPECINDSLKKTLDDISKELKMQEREGLDPEVKIDLIDVTFRAWAMSNPFSSGVSGEARGIKVLDDGIILDNSSNFTNAKK